MLEKSNYLAQIVQTIPIEVYNELRSSAGRSKKSQEAVSIGLNNSICNIIITEKVTQKIVGMARLVGDGGTFCAIVNICVLAPHKNKGVEQLLMKEMMEYINNNIPKTCFVVLIASPELKSFYEKFGFTSDTIQNKTGMFFKK